MGGGKNSHRGTKRQRHRGRWEGVSDGDEAAEAARPDMAGKRRNGLTGGGRIGKVGVRHPDGCRNERFENGTIGSGNGHGSAKRRETSMKPCCNEFLSKQFGGDQAVVEEIYAEYRKELGKMLGELPDAIARGEWDVVDRLAHTLKGNSLAVGDAETAEVAIAMRGAAKLGDGDRANECLVLIQELAAGL